MEKEEQEEVMAEPVVSLMTPGQQYAANRVMSEHQVRFHTGGTPFKATKNRPAENQLSTPELLFRHRQKLFCDQATVDPLSAQQDSQVDDGFEDTQDCPFSEDYYNY